MTLRDKAAAKLRMLREKIKDKETRRKVRAEVDKRLDQGRKIIERLEKEVRDPENQARVENKVRDARNKLVRAKAEFAVKRAKAVAYTKNNPEKAMAVAAAAGALAGALWAVVRRKK